MQLYNKVAWEPMSYAGQSKVWTPTGDQTARELLASK